MKTADQIFIDAFKKSQEALGLIHFRTSFELDNSMLAYASIHRNSVDCTAHVKFNPQMMERDKVLVSTAVHEVAHLLVQDLRWSAATAPEHIADTEDERIASRLEPLLLKAIFPNQKTK
jgi:hypothetical protein